MTLFSGLNPAAVDPLTGEFSLGQHVLSMIDGQINITDNGTIPKFGDIVGDLSILRPSYGVPDGSTARIVLSDIGLPHRYLATLTADVNVSLNRFELAPGIVIEGVISGRVVANGIVVVPEVDAGILVGASGIVLAFVGWSRARRSAAAV